MRLKIYSDIHLSKKSNIFYALNWISQWLLILKLCKMVKTVEKGWKGLKMYKTMKMVKNNFKKYFKKKWQTLKNGFKKGTKQWKTVKTMKTVKLFETGGNSKRWTTLNHYDKKWKKKNCFWLERFKKRKILFC